MSDRSASTGTSELDESISPVWTGLHTFDPSTDSASVQVQKIGNTRATPADNDEAYASLTLNDSGTNETEAARLTWSLTDVTDATEDGDFILDLINAGTLTEQFRFTSDGDLSLGSGSAEIQTAGGGSDSVTVRNTGNSKDIARFNESSSEFEVPNGPITCNGDKINNQDITMDGSNAKFQFINSAVQVGRDIKGFTNNNLVLQSFEDHKFYSDNTDQETLAVDKNGVIKLVAGGRIDAQSESVEQGGSIDYNNPTVA